MRVVVLAAVLTLAACGAAERASRDVSAADTRFAGVRFTQQCAREAGLVAVVVLCPTRMPLGAFEVPRDYGDAPCTYLINLEPRGTSKIPGAVFHLLFGGTCRRWDLRTRGDRWPARLTAVPAGEDLRLIGTTTLLAGQTEAAHERLRVLRHARVGSAAALVLRNPPYPVGGIHGGHVSVVWNAGGAGYLVTGHATASREQPDAVAGPRALARATATLLALARSLRRPTS